MSQLEAIERGVAAIALSLEQILKLMSPRESKDLLFVSEVAEELKLSVRQIQRLVKRGKLPKIDVGNRSVRFRAADIERYKSGTSTAPKHGRRQL